MRTGLDTVPANFGDFEFISDEYFFITYFNVNIY